MTELLDSCFLFALLLLLALARQLAAWGERAFT